MAYVMKWLLLMQRRPGQRALHSLSQSQKELLDLALPTFPALCRLPATAYVYLSLLSCLQHQGQWSHGPADNTVSLAYFVTASFLSSRRLPSLAVLGAITLRMGQTAIEKHAMPVGLYARNCVQYG